MLYVSRCLGIKGAYIAGTGYWVVDTEDCTEMFMPWARLVAMMQPPKTEPLDIKGVICDWEPVTVKDQVLYRARKVRISIYSGQGTIAQDKLTVVS